MLWFTHFKKFHIEKKKEFHFENGNFIFLLVVQCKPVFYFLLTLAEEFQYFFPWWSVEPENMSEIFVNLIIVNCTWLKKFGFTFMLTFLK